MESSKKNKLSFMTLLEDRGLSPENVAEALGVTPRAVYYWLSGQRIPKLTIAQSQALCSLLGCSIHDLPESFSSEPFYEAMNGKN